MSLTREQFEATLLKAYEQGIWPTPTYVLREKVFRTGRQRLLMMDGHFFMEIRNHTYSSRQRVPMGSIPRWYAYFAQ